MEGVEIETSIFDGPGAEIVAFADQSGKVPLHAFLESLSNTMPHEFAKMQALLLRVTEVGPQRIRNSTRLKSLGRGLLEMKAGPVRIFWIYGTTRGARYKPKVVLLDGVVKKTDRLRSRDIKRARLLQSYYKKGMHQ